jgi:glycosyltransferase involved in cell wall biosynthesis
MRKVIFIWGDYPPTTGGASVRIFRITQELSKKFNIELFCQAIPLEPRIKRSANMAVIRVKPSEPKLVTAKSPIRIIIGGIIRFLTRMVRLLILLPLLIYSCWKEKPIAIIKEATRWDFGDVERKILTTFPAMVHYRALSPWFIAAKLFKIPLCIYFTNMWYFRENRPYIQSNVRYADQIWAVDKWMIPYIHKYTGTKEVHYLPVCINVNQFERNNNSYPTRNRILFVARLTRERGCDVLIKAVPLIIRAIPDLEVCIVGNGSETQRLIEMTKDLRIIDHVTFLGSVPPAQISGVYNGTKVFVNPMRVPGIGNVTLEALASGIPVIKSKIQTLDNTPIVDGENGYLFDDNDSGDLARKIIMLLEKNEEEWLLMSENARKTANTYNIKDNCQIWLNLLNNLEKGRTDFPQ